MIVFTFTISNAFGNEVPRVNIKIIMIKNPITKRITLFMQTLQPTSAQI